jgi:peptidoglycan L-alanyl-D-glutamate endopeptidase CwlK
LRKFGKSSAARLRQCHKDLISLCEAVLQDMDISVICGYRGEAEQNAAFAAGNSKLKYPKSKHNKIPSMAVDVVPYPVDWSDTKRFLEMCKLFEQHAEKLGIEIRLGRDFSFVDLPHFELMEKKN